jgi:hypothetical protein
MLEWRVGISAKKSSSRMGSKPGDEGEVGEGGPLSKRDVFMGWIVTVRAMVPAKVLLLTGLDPGGG